MFVFYFFILTIMFLQSDVSKFKFCEQSKSDELQFVCFLGGEDDCRLQDILNTVTKVAELDIIIFVHI